MEIKIETNAELTDMFVRAHSFLTLPKPQRKEAKVRRPHYDEPWYRDIRIKGYGKCCPTCNVAMTKSKHEDWSAPNDATVEHIVPLQLGGDNKTGGTYPNCIAMCYACNQARNSVVRLAKKTNRVVSAVKFLIEQVYCIGVQLNKNHLSSYQHFIIQEKNKTLPSRVKRQQRQIKASRAAPPPLPKNTDQVSIYDLRHRSAIHTLYHSFDQIWRNEKQVRKSHLHPVVHEAWFPKIDGGTRVEFRSKKKVKRWMKMYLSNQISQTTFLTEFKPDR